MSMHASKRISIKQVAKMSELVKKLVDVQAKLKAPKGQYNSFGKYSYRNCEDILQAVKPLLAENGLLLSISDSVVMVGDRVYIEAAARITDGSESHEVKAYARESLTKKGMDDSQVTGAASSYARKYALNGLFAIDDTKDADSHDNSQQTATKQAGTINQQQEQELAGAIVAKGYAVTAACEAFGVHHLNQIKSNQLPLIMSTINQWPQAGENQ